MRRIVKELKLPERPFTPRQILAVISNAKNEGVNAEAFQRQGRSPEDRVYATCYLRYMQMLEQSGAVDFDDLLVKSVALLQLPHIATIFQRMYSYILVDEYQDTNQVQYEMVRRLAGSQRNLFVVGDDDQSIYGWRGANVRNIRQFEQDFPGAEVIVLGENYRSTQQILNVAQRLIDAAPQRPYRKVLQSQQPAGEAVFWQECANQNEESQRVCDIIERLVANGAVQYGDCAIMYRTNAQSRPFEEALARRRIPYTLVGGMRFYERREIKDMLAWLRLLYNPNDDVSLLRVCEEYAEGVGAGSMAHLTTWATAQGCSLFAAFVHVATDSDALPQLKGVSRQRLLKFAARVHHLMQSATTTPLVDVFAQVMVEINLADHFERQYGRDEARLRLENINELQRVAGEYAELPVDLQLGQFLEEVALVADVDVLDKQASQKGQVICITMHQAKGLEYDNVFLVGLEDNIIPHVRTHLDPHQVEEERRILYVGMTRARKRLYLMRAVRRAVFGNPEPTKRSRFLADIPMEQLTVLTGNGVVAPRSVRSAANPAYQGWGNAAAFQQPKTTPTLDFAVGDHVRHQRFGEGIVLAAKVVDDDVEVVVRFADRAVGEKKLIASFARLQKITLPEDPNS
jgi:DNA helicase-2/ATP-dependent DNA helicase PcrA